MAEPTVQVPVSRPTREQISDRLIERLRNSGGWPIDEVWQRWQNLFTEYDRDIALFSQPTPSAEPRTLFDQVLAEHKRSDGDEGDGYTSPREHWIQCSCGTLLYIQMQGSGSWCPDNDLDDFEDVWALHVLTAALSSTIRDVQPPKET